MAATISSAMASADLQLDAPAAGLAMDADAHLHLVVAEREGRLAGGRHRATGQRHAHRAGARVDPLAERLQRGEIACPASAAAPTIFSTISVPATPRRPVV